MPHSPTPVRRRDRSWPRTVARGLFAFAALAALVAGVPALLLAVGTLPATVPTLDKAREVLLSPDDDGSGLLATMTVAAWIAWLWLVVPVLIEIVAVLARRTTPRLPGMATGQRLAGFLLGSIVLASPAAAASASAPAVAATATHVPSTGQATGGPAPTAAAEKMATAGSSRECTVGAEDTTWWELAEQLLGDGTRYTELQRLNPEVPTTAMVVPQGTTLRMPGHADVRSEAADTSTRTQLVSSTHDAPDRGEDVVTVEAGDSLSEIAAAELHDGSKWPQLFEASKGTSQPDGLPRITDPDVIYPGQQVTVPGTASDKAEQPREDGEGGAGNERSTPPAQDDNEQEPGAGAGGGESAAPGGSAASGAETPAPSESSRPAEQPSQGQGAAPTRPSTGSSVSPAPESGEPTAPSTPTTAASEAPSSEAPASPSGQVLQLRMVLGAGALLAAAVTGALATRRMLQRRRRKPGETIAITSETSAAEAQLAAAAEPGGSDRLDVALRTMAHQLEEGAGLPGLRAARIGARTLEVLPEDLTLEPLPPFAAGRAGWWVLPGDSELLNDEAAREVPAPYPGLVTVGSTADGHLLLVNLAQLPTLLLDGDPTRVAEVCTSLAVEIGMSPWGGVVEVVVIGFGEDLPRLLPTSRIMHMREALHALRDLSERLLEVHQMPETDQHPYLLLCAASLGPDTAWQFAEVIDKARIPVTLIAPASVASHFPDAELLNADLDEPQQLDYAGTEITVQRLERAAFQQIATALAVSGQPAMPAEGPWEDVPEEPEPEVKPSPVRAAADGQGPGAGTYAAGSASITPVTAHGSDGDGGVFPALLAASADPASLRLLPAAPPPGQDEPAGDQALAEDPVEDEAPQEPGAQLTETGDGRGAEGPETHDLHAPEIRVLGPVEVDGVAASGHGPRIAQLAALLFFRPGRSADALCSDMDPLAPWSSNTLNARLRGLRSALGNDPAGDAYVPRRRTGDDPYRLSPAVRCDWTRFLQLAERALPHGPAGLKDLEKALGMVRGRPFGSRPLSWAGPYQQEMITRIIDVAHTVATHRTPSGPQHDLTAARQAIATGLDVDISAELLYRDWMRVEHAAGNRSGLHTAVTQVQQVNRSLDCDLEMETEQLINDLLHGTGPGLHKAQ
ncbi:LysM peptidoglycan-binding domain-containing protein [Streptomyces griseiscabiei]|uniref:LysM peptidoglycan-binding domain-containing protein n=1 Tax=Streptomyces griseiscabiei TaxID=2993540 RepID=A0ABU4LJZ8_9ACTN|nr:LysM peptidoglycan-binding domain-containing protein [Streptomyces griseiscabiei]MBZ3906556.1 LysM peptidoglycan-binding domain-containing protein [Streptomyces griseiscabiei]MDX2916152.1 LysM peptidoglycan-binding domain-containing protein [Streptomyces griseiscabiei]